MNEPESEGPSWGLVLVRLATGAILAVAGWHKILGGVGADLVLSTKERVAQGPGWFEAFMNAVVYPFPEAFAQIIQWGELVGGIALFLGALTRPVGIFAALMLACFAFAGPIGELQFQLLLALCALACAISRAGRRVGLDVLLDGHFPPGITWVREA
ncbi:MAG TPA: DoxX family protein [Planctomycetota bacterium]|nr:DoxX family protein [Planctomycetota bacterium]